MHRNLTDDLVTAEGHAEQVQARFRGCKCERIAASGRFCAVGGGNLAVYPHQLHPVRRAGQVARHVESDLEGARNALKTQIFQLSGEGLDLGCGHLDRRRVPLGLKEHPQAVAGGYFAGFALISHIHAVAETREVRKSLELKVTHAIGTCGQGDLPAVAAITRFRNISGIVSGIICRIDLEEYGLADKVVAFLNEELEGIGAVRNTLKKYM